MREKKDYIGPDPLIWIDRLLVVAEGSQFKDEQKRLIVKRLGALQGELLEMEKCSRESSR